MLDELHLLAPSHAVARALGDVDDVLLGAVVALVAAQQQQSAHERTHADQCDHEERHEDSAAGATPGGVVGVVVG